MTKWLTGGLPAGFLLTLAVCFVSASGCQKSTPDSTTVSGTVMCKDVPIQYGIVVFHNDAGRVGMGEIRLGGAYRIANLPEGEVKICVRVSTLDAKLRKEKKSRGEKVDKPADTETSRLMDKLTKKYGKVETTPLRFAIQAGEQQHDIVLSLP
jgi:hypothetical protein